MTDEQAETRSEPRTTDRAGKGPDTPPVVGDAAPAPAGPRPDGAAPPESAAPAAAPYTQFKVINWADTLGRAFVELQGRMGEAPIYRGVVLIERLFADGSGFRGQRAFDIPATCADEAFQKFDAARDAARKAGEEEADRDHTRAVLSGQIPIRPPIQMPLRLPKGGGGQRRRVN
jgi:hypothetical protein